MEAKSGRLFVAIIALCALLFTACATPRAVSNGRRGLMAELEGDSVHTTRSHRDHRGGAPEGARVSSELGELGKVAAQLHLTWPLQLHEVTSEYGKRKRNFHEGVDFRAKPGTPVIAAQSGRVIYAGKRIRGYGNMLVLKHEHGVATVYAHNSRLLVHEGQTLKKGQKIAVSGNTGRSTGPHLHFEVRIGPDAVDPMVFLASGNGGLTKNRTWNKALGKLRYIHLTMRPPASNEPRRTRD